MFSRFRLRSHRFGPAGRLVFGVAILGISTAAAAFFTSSQLATAPRDGAPVEAVRGARSIPGTATPTATAPAPTPAPTAPPLPARIVLPGLSTAAPPPPPAPLDPAFVQLEADIRSAVETYWSEGQFAVAITDLHTGNAIGVNADLPQLSGCVMNFFVILQAVLGVQEGRYPLEAIDSLIRATIWSSNAVTARDLYAIAGDGDVVAGVARVAGLIETLGLPEIIIDHPPAYPGESLGIDLNNWITAAAVNRALVMLYEGAVLDEQHTAYLMEAMTGVKPGLNYLVAYTPGEAVVSHKNGFFWGSNGYVDNDTGIVRFERNGTTYAYALTFLSQGVPGKYNDIPLANEVSTLVWDYFTATYTGD